MTDRELRRVANEYGYFVARGQSLRNKRPAGVPGRSEDDEPHLIRSAGVVRVCCAAIRCLSWRFLPFGLVIISVGIRRRIEAVKPLLVRPGLGLPTAKCSLLLWF